MSRLKIVALVTSALLLAYSLGGPRSVRAQFDPLTAGAVLGAAALTKSVVDTLISDAAGEVKDVLQEAARVLDDLIRHINDAYGDMLNATISELDAFSRDQLSRLNALVQKLRADLQVDLAHLNETILNDVKVATAQVRTVLADARELIQVTAAGTVLVVDKAAFNGLLIAAVGLLAIGLLVFVRLLFTRRLPADRTRRSLILGGMAAFTALFAALILPQGRAYALTWSDFGGRVEALTQPIVTSVSPATVVIGRTQEIYLTGSELAPLGRLPNVDIGGTAVPVTGGNEALALRITGLTALAASGTQTIRVTTAEDPPKIATASVKITERRPLPRVISWTLTPTGTAWEAGGHVTSPSIGCRAPARRLFDTDDCSKSETIRVLPGYYLDIDRPAQLGRKPGGETFSNGGNAQAGFSETITTFERRRGDPRDPRRTITYDGAAIPRGITVSVRAWNDAGQVSNGKRAEFYATYTVYGRRENRRAIGRAWTFQGSCAISGTVRCGSYPYAGELERLSRLQYTADVTFRDANNSATLGSGTLTPNDGSSFLPAALQYEDADGRLASATFTFRIVDRSVQVAGPDLGVAPAPLVGNRLNEILSVSARARIRSPR